MVELVIANKYKTYDYKNVSAIDIVRWVYSQKCIPIPCRPKTKKPILDICQYKDLENGYSYGLFNDSYHVASKERVEWINNYWNRWNSLSDDIEMVQRLSETISIALNTGNGWNNNQHLCVIDIDNTEFIDSFNVDLFRDCPRVYGKKGIKLLFFSEGSVEQGEIGDEQHAIDLYFSPSRLVFIYGEHDKSKPDNPVFYRMDGLKPIPHLERPKVMDFLNTFANENDLKLKLKKEELEPIKQLPKINKFGKSKPTLTSWSNLRLSDVIQFNTTKIAHPVHGSTTGVNMSLNLSDDTWYCHRCHTGGGVLELIAVVEGIIDCSESQRGLFDFTSSKNVDRWLDLKKILEDKYGVDVFGYEVNVRKWYNGNKKGISDLF